MYEDAALESPDVALFGQCTFRYFWGISHLIKYKTGNAPKGHSFPPLTRQRGAGKFFLGQIHILY
jgi:hypothetical protein